MKTGIIECVQEHTEGGRLVPHLCPQCGSVAEELLEVLFASAAIEVYGDGSWEYSGDGSDIHWDSQTTVVYSGEFELKCRHNHSWRAKPLPVTE